MARRSKQSDPKIIREELIALLHEFKADLNRKDLRLKVQRLIPAVHKLRDLGGSLIPKNDASSGMDRILLYLRKYPCTIIKGDELMVVSGINDWPRRVRQLHTELGWHIVSGIPAKQMAKEGEFRVDGVSVDTMKSDDYMLLSDRQDKEAAFRWKLANTIRKKKGNVHEKIIEFMRQNLEKPVSGEELRYITNNQSDWARRVRELRTEHGWPIVTKYTGRPDLTVGVYVLETDRQSPEHDREIKDAIRTKVLERDDYHCVKCGWHHGKWNRSDPRILELHHKIHHAKGGENSVENLITVCTKCHDGIHREEK